MTCLYAHQLSLIDKLFLPGNKLDSIMWPLFVLLFTPFHDCRLYHTSHTCRAVYSGVGHWRSCRRRSGRMLCAYGSSPKMLAKSLSLRAGGLRRCRHSFIAGTTRATSTAVIVTRNHRFISATYLLGVLPPTRPTQFQNLLRVIEANHFLCPKLAYKLGNSPR